MTQKTTSRFQVSAWLQEYLLSFRIETLLPRSLRMKRFIFTVLTLCLFTAGVLAQSTSGSLTGTVSGPDGVLPGASILIKDNQTGKELTDTANDSGSFKFPQLEVGTYTVTIKAPNFKTFVATDLKI